MSLALHRIPQSFAFKCVYAGFRTSQQSDRVRLGLSGLTLYSLRMDIGVVLECAIAWLLENITAVTMQFDDIQYGYMSIFDEDDAFLNRFQLQQTGLRKFTSRPWGVVCVETIEHRGWKVYIRCLALANRGDTIVLEAWGYQLERIIQEQV